LESAKLNIGDYSDQPNVGGQFPIGEVFTESKDLERVSGVVELFGFGASDFSVSAPEGPIRLTVEAGRIVSADSAPEDFQSILSEIREAEGEIWLRELGFGLNQAFTRERRVSDVGSYERMCGIHLSLGAKHAIYAKPGFSKRRVKYHVDVFAAVERAEIDGEAVYADGRYVIL
jgi:aminopeptidase